VRETERDIMLFLLAISAGSTDGWSYFGLGHAFVANMTGNTVLAGMAVFQKGGHVSHPLLSLGCYALGVAAAAFFTRKVRQGVVWARAITRTLLLEALIMIGAAVAWIGLHRSIPANPSRLLTLLLGCVAFAIGLQSGAMLQLKIPGVVTTYITGTWTSLMNGLVLYATNREPKASRQRHQLSFDERLVMQAGILAVYFLSAVLTGWLFHHQPQAVGGLSALSILIVAVYAAAHTEQA
jgi:uncharacterized membrane protein YoaK (UPF0700 family)